MPVLSITNWPANPLLLKEKKPIKPSAMVLSIKGAPKIEPTPIS